MKHYRLHLTTRCGCTRIIDNGIEAPPLEYELALAPGQVRRRREIVELNLADVVGNAPMPIPIDFATRVFSKVGYSGTADIGTAYYQEV